MRSRVLLHLADVRIETLAAHSDETDGDAIVGANDPAFGRGLILPVNWRLEHIGDCHRGGRRGCFLNEIPARFAACFRLISHKTLSYFSKADKLPTYPNNRTEVNPETMIGLVQNSRPELARTIVVTTIF
jgi:hypothetical protein